MAHKQPSMERHLRAAMDKRFGELRSGCTIVAIAEDEENVFADYDDQNGQRQRVRAKFLVGTDGKTGFTRKKYLEPRGVIMEKNPE